MLLTIRKQLYDFLLFLIFILAWCPKTPVSPPASQNLNGPYRVNYETTISLKILFLAFKKKFFPLLCLTGTVDKRVQFKIPKFIIYAAMTAYSYDDGRQNTSANSYLHETHFQFIKIFLSFC